MLGINKEELIDLKNMIRDSKLKFLENEKKCEKPAATTTAQNDKKIEENDQTLIFSEISKNQEELLKEFVCRPGRPRKNSEDKSKKETVYFKPENLKYLKRFKPEYKISKKVNFIIEDYQRLSQWQKRVVSRFDNYSRKIDLITKDLDQSMVFDFKTTANFSAQIFTVAKEIRTYMNILDIQMKDIEMSLSSDVLRNLTFVLNYTR